MLLLLLEVTVENTGPEGGEKKQLEQMCVLALHPTCILISLLMKNCIRKTLK